MYVYLHFIMALKHESSLIHRSIKRCMRVNLFFNTIIVCFYKLKKNEMQINHKIYIFFSNPCTEFLHSNKIKFDMVTIYMSHL